MYLEASTAGLMEQVSINSTTEHTETKIPDTNSECSVAMDLATRTISN